MNKKKDRAVDQQDQDAARAHRNMRIYGFLTVVSIMAFVALITWIIFWVIL